MPTMQHQNVCRIKISHIPNTIIRKCCIKYFSLFFYREMVYYNKKVEGGNPMAPKAVVVNELLDTLEEQDYDTVIDFIQFLSNKRKTEKINKSSKILSEIQSMFSEDKGWDSEDSMIRDMAAFRKERMGL